jgi:hypothetical protein
MRHRLTLSETTRRRDDPKRPAVLLGRIERTRNKQEENANMTSFRHLTGLAGAAALGAATPAYAVLNHNALVSNTLVQNALAAVGSALADLNRAATEPAAVPDGAGGVLVVDDSQARAP